MTSIEGLYAFGEVNFAFHGANRLGANALLSCIFDGLFSGVGVVNYIRDGVPSTAPAESIPQGVFDGAVGAEESRQKTIVDTASAGDHADETNPYIIAREMGEEMTAGCTVVREDARLQKTLDKIAELRDRWGRMKLADGATWTNQSLSFARSVGDMLSVADAMASGAKARKESRGAHFRIDHTERDDANFMKTTFVTYDAGEGRGRVEYREVRADLVEPRARTYGKVDKEEPAKAEAAAAGV